MPSSDSHILPGTTIEIRNPQIVRGKIKFAIFDFDGTISLIREGWQNIMIPMMVDVLIETPTDESRSELEQVVRTFVANTTGKQTIYQMIRLAEEVQKRGGAPEEPLEYKQAYHDRLMEQIVHRRNGLRNGDLVPEEWAVPGSLDALRAIKERETICFLTSGTDENYVLEEADLLGIRPYFDGIYGAQDNYKSFSKRMIIQKIIEDNQLQGPELVSFGDGYVEIEDTKCAGGITVGVATNETERKGIDEWKRNRLIASGADIIMPNFRQHRPLFNYLFAEGD
jgi:phosphoglycolate phosphatase-like HAD superfamily hydrolase